MEDFTNQNVQFVRRDRRFDFNITYVSSLWCNYKCNYCIQGKTSHDITQKTDAQFIEEFSNLGKLIKLVNETHNYHAIRLELLGGEITFIDLVKYIDVMTSMIDKPLKEAISSIVVLTNLSNTCEYYTALIKHVQDTYGVSMQLIVTFHHDVCSDATEFIHKCTECSKLCTVTTKFLVNDTKNPKIEYAIKLAIESGIRFLLARLQGKAEDGFAERVKTDFHNNDDMYKLYGIDTTNPNIDKLSYVVKTDKGEFNVPDAVKIIPYGLYCTSGIKTISVCSNLVYGNSCKYSRVNKIDILNESAIKQLISMINVCLLNTPCKICSFASVYRSLSDLAQYENINLSDYMVYQD